VTIKYSARAAGFGFDKDDPVFALVLMALEPIS